MPNLDTDDALATLMAQHQLPPEYRQTLSDVIEPLALSLYQASEAPDTPLVVGIHGAQGTGKSTLTDFLRVLLAYRYRCSTASLSLDDIYHTRETRCQLAEEVHPLMITRGVPGTHDLDLGHKVLDQLVAANAGSRTAIPVFNKAIDDREPEARWPLFIGRPRIILVEGWCLGASPQPEADLREAANELEQKEDSDGRWRSYVNLQLAGPYKTFFHRIGQMIMLRAPSMAAVVRWRTQQEHRLAEAQTGARDPEVDSSAPPRRIMTDDQLRRFIMHYERITRHCLEEIPGRADVLLLLDENHNLIRA